MIMFWFSFSAILLSPLFLKDMVKKLAELAEPEKTMDQEFDDC